MLSCVSRGRLQLWGGVRGAQIFYLPAAPPNQLSQQQPLPRVWFWCLSTSQVQCANLGGKNPNQVQKKTLLTVLCLYRELNRHHHVGLLMLTTPWRRQEAGLVRPFWQPVTVGHCKRAALLKWPKYFVLWNQSKFRFLFKWNYSSGVLELIFIKLVKKKNSNV